MASPLSTSGLQKLKPSFHKSLNAAAEAATHKDYLRDRRVAMAASKNQPCAIADLAVEKPMLSRLPVGVGSYSRASANCRMRRIPWPPTCVSSRELTAGSSGESTGLKGGASSSTAKTK